MWLPKDERKLLTLYFRTIGNPAEQETFKDFSDMKVLGWKQRKSNKDYDQVYMNRVWCADDILKKRGFLGSLTRDSFEKTLSLTIEGYDLGRKYDSLWQWSNLWYAEHIKNHWIWHIIAYIAGIISMLILNWLSKK